MEPWDSAGFYTKLLTDTSPNILIMFKILQENMPRFSTFLITSCGNEGSDDLGRDFMTENQILSSRRESCSVAEWLEHQI